MDPLTSGELGTIHAETEATPSDADCATRTVSIGNRPIAIRDGLFTKTHVASLFKDLANRADLCFGRVNSLASGQPPLLMSDIPISGIRSNCLITALATQALHEVRRVGPGTYSLYRAQVNFNTYGDVQYIHQDGQNVATTLYFANPRWDPDWMGELLFYDDAGSEVLAAVSPKPGRLVVFDGAILHRGGVPSRLCMKPRVVIVLKFRRTIHAPRT